MVANDARWFQNLSDLCDFCNRYKRLPTVKDNALSTVGTDLCSWIRNQKTAYNNKTLNSNRVEALEKYLGTLWKNYLLGTTSVVMDTIPDKGLDFSITTLYHRGLIDIKTYSQLRERNVLYL